MKSIELDDLKPKNCDKPQHWNDWYFTANFTHEGKDYWMVLSIAEGTFMGGSGIGLGLAADPFSPVLEGDAHTVGKAEKQIAIHKLCAPDALQFTETDTITVEMDDLKAVCKPNQQKMVSANETIRGELTCTPRGPVLRWGNKKEGKSPVTKGTSVCGVESLSDVSGTMVVNGEEIKIKGRGVFEHVWIDALNFMNIRVMDWVYANFDEAYMFLCHCESISDDGTPYHYEEGLIYLMETTDYLVVRGLTFVPETWVYLKPFRRFIPSRQKVTVSTDKGTLEMKIGLSLYPQIAQTMRMEPLIMHNITGWNVMFFDAPIGLEGKFTYTDGEAVELHSGKGVNEQLRILPL